MVRIDTTGEVAVSDLPVLRQAVRAARGATLAPVLVAGRTRVYSVHVRPATGTFARNFAFHLVMVLGEPDERGGPQLVRAVVGVDTRLDERRRGWLSLRQSISRAAAQLVNGPPGIAAIHYADPVLDFDLVSPDGAPMLAHVIKLLERCPNLAGVVLSAE